jgi:glycosyltransferase involved in cell wall biosynthesis
MKIILATEAYYPLIDGGAVAEHHLALGLASRGHEVHILAPSENFTDYEEDDNGTTIHRFASLPIPFVKNDHRLALFPSAKIARLLDRLKPDVAHIHNPFPIGKATLAYCLAHKVPVVATNHWLPENITTFMAKFRFLNNMDFLVKMNWKFIADFHNKCQYVTSPTQTAVDLMLQNGLVAPNNAVSNGVNLNVFNPALDATPLRTRLGIPNKPIAMYAGRLSGEKHVDVFVRAMPAVLAACDVHFVIGGNGREKAALQESVRELGIEEHVTFPGFLEDPEFPLLYRMGSIFVMPSICELQSITTLEAMASGLPVVAANKYALPELVKPGQNGFLFEPGDSDTLAKHLIAMFQDETGRKAMGEESLRIVSAHSIDASLTNYEALYTKVQSDTTKN